MCSRFCFKICSSTSAWSYLGLGMYKNYNAQEVANRIIHSNINNACFQCLQVPWAQQSGGGGEARLPGCNPRINKLDVVIKIG
jgi:hypothetical protein